MNNTDDSASKVIFSVLDNLVLKNPKGVGAGAMLAWFLHTLSIIFHPVIYKEFGIDLSTIGLWGWMGVGIPAFSISYFLKKDLPEDAEDLLVFIRLIKKTSLSDAEKRYRQRKLIAEYSMKLLMKDREQKQLDSKKIKGTIPD